jgi:hypothetical protein
VISRSGHRSRSSCAALDHGLGGGHLGLAHGGGGLHASGRVAVSLRIGPPQPWHGQRLIGHCASIAQLQFIAGFTNYVPMSQTITIFYHVEIVGSYGGYTGELASRSSQQPSASGAGVHRSEAQMNEFGRLLENEIPRMRRYARALTRNTAKADDLVQSSLVRARKTASLAARLKPPRLALHDSAQSTCQRRSPLASSGIGRTGGRRGAWVERGAGCRRLVAAERSATGDQRFVARTT